MCQPLPSGLGDCRVACLARTGSSVWPQRRHLIYGHSRNKRHTLECRKGGACYGSEPLDKVLTGHQTWSWEEDNDAHFRITSTILCWIQATNSSSGCYLRVHLRGSVDGRLQGVRGQGAGVRLGGLQPRDGGVSACELGGQQQSVGHLGVDLAMSRECWSTTVLRP